MPLPVPALFDWLDQHPEPGQTFEQFVRSRPERPGLFRKRIYLQPLGEFPPGTEPSVGKLQKFAAAFFQMDVVVRPPLSLTGEGITKRRNPGSGERQLLTGALLRFLERHRPADAYAFLGLTLEDLYPSEQWNYVFGIALRRVGVYSFARYDPLFFHQARPAGWQRTALLRSCKVLGHEGSHIFGIPHCTAFHCLVNGSNSLEETDLLPPDLCPIDLHKLHASIGFDVMQRYRELLVFAEQEGFEEEAAWFRRRIKHLGG